MQPIKLLNNGFHIKQVAYRFHAIENKAESRICQGLDSIITVKCAYFAILKQELITLEQIALRYVTLVVKLYMCRESGKFVGHLLKK